MQRLQWHDLQMCLCRAPRAVLEMMKEHGSNMICAGGFVRGCTSGETLNDMDIFSPNKSVSLLLAQLLHAKTGGQKGNWYATDNAYTVHIRGHYDNRPAMPVQFIHRWSYLAPGECLASFDFTIACAAFWYDRESAKWTSLCDDRFYADLAAKRLVYRAPLRAEDAGGSMLRVLKFYQRGYRIPLDSLGAVVARLAVAVRWDELFNQGLTEPEIEAKVAKVITGLLREVDPNIDPNHIAHLLSESAQETETNAPEITEVSVIPDAVAGASEVQS